MEENFLRSPTIIRNSISTTLSFSLPISHYIVGDYADLHFDDDYDDDSDGDAGSTADDHASWKPLLILDVIWNLVFVVVSLAVLCTTVKEKPPTPLRVWIGGYAFQCFLHVGFVYSEFRRKVKLESYGDLGGVSFSSDDFSIRIAKKLEAANTMVSSFWWVPGFYWIMGGEPSILIDSPRLYWIAVVYLSLDIFFMVFCIGIACAICLVLFFCVPVAAIVYAMTIREGASEDELRILPKYKFHRSCATMTAENNMKHFSTDRNSINEVALRLEDCSEMAHSTFCTSYLWSCRKLAHFAFIRISRAGVSSATTSLSPETRECCICLMAYSEGAELCSLPCNHHFHYSCITTWLQINATCPLCKYNILKGDRAV